MKWLLWLAIFVLSGVGVGAEPGHSSAAPRKTGRPESLRILMLGNSYTAMSWRQLVGFLDADPKIDAQLRAYCPGGKTLAEHAANRKVEELLGKRGEWDVVVLQEQSQLPAYALGVPGNEKLRRQLDAGAPVLIRRIHKLQPRARIVLFETWARHRDPDKQQTLAHFGGDPAKMQSALTAAYQRMRRNPGKWDFSKFVAIAPVGRAFAAWYAENGYGDPRRKLHRPDNSHPSKLGAFLAGAVLYETITGRPATGVDYLGPLKKLPDGVKLAAELKRCAHRTVEAARKNSEEKQTNQPGKTK